MYEHTMRMQSLGKMFLRLFLLSCLLNACPRIASWPNPSKRDRWGDALRKLRSPMVNDKKLAELGTRLLSHGKYDDAYHYYTKAIDKNPLEPSYFRLLGNSLAKLGDINSAIISYEKAISFNQNADVDKQICTEETLNLDDRDLMMIGQHLLLQHRYEGAIVCFTQAIKNPGNSMYHKKRGLCQKKLENFDSAILDFKRELRINPEDTICFGLMIQTLLDCKRYDEALKETFSRNDSSELEQLAKRFIFMDSFKEASHCYDELIEKSSEENSEYYERRGFCAWKLEDPKTAIVNFKRCVEIDPENVSAWTFLVQILFDSESYDEAVKECIKWNNVNELEHLGHKLFSMQKFEQALDCYSAATKANPPEASYHTMQGSCLKKLNKFDAAISEFRKAVLIDPDVKNGRIFLCETWFDIGRSEEAERELLKMNDFELWKLGDKFFTKQEFEKALHCFTKAIEKKSEEEISKSLYYEDRGRCYMKLGNLKEAIGDYEKSLKLEPINMRLQIDLCELLVETSMLAEAKEALKNVNEIFEYFMLAEDSDRVANISQRIEEIERLYENDPSRGQQVIE